LPFKGFEESCVTKGDVFLSIRESIMEGKTTLLGENAAGNLHFSL